MKFSKTTLFSKKSNEEKAESLKRLFGTIGIWKSYGEVDLNFFENLFALQVRVIIIFYFFLLTPKSKSLAILTLFVWRLFHCNKECYMFDPQPMVASFYLSFS